MHRLTQMPIPTHDVTEVCGKLQQIVPTARPQGFARHERDASWGRGSIGSRSDGWKNPTPEVRRPVMASKGEKWYKHECICVR